MVHGNRDQLVQDILKPSIKNASEAVPAHDGENHPWKPASATAWRRTIPEVEWNGRPADLKFTRSGQCRSRCT